MKEVALVIILGQQAYTGTVLGKLGHKVTTPSTHFTVKIFVWLPVEVWNLVLAEVQGFSLENERK